MVASAVVFLFIQDCILVAHSSAWHRGGTRETWVGEQMDNGEKKGITF